MEETKPLVSFIIPVYNVPAPMLRECVESILGLSLRPFEREIIIIDDGSTNSTLNDLGELADGIIYMRQRNAGVSAARNLGLRMATGRFLQFIDGDDRLVPAPYEHVLDLLRYGQSDMVLFDFTARCPQPDSMLYDDHGPMAGCELLRTENIHGSACGYAFSRSIVGSLRFTPGVDYGEDEEFTPQLLLRAESATRTTAQAYYYRQRPTSATGTSSIRCHIRRLEDTKGVIIRLRKIADRLPTADRVAMQRRTAQLTMDYIYNIMATLRSTKHLERRLGELRRQGLFPLPDHPYTTKYKWFSRLTATRAGRRLMLLVLPLMRRER